MSMSDLTRLPHPHYCACGDFRVCSKDCARGEGVTPWAPWVCPDCEVTQRLVDLETAELARLKSQHRVVNAIVDRIFQGDK